MLDLSIGQIPHSTEHISSYVIKLQNVLCIYICVCTNEQTWYIDKVFNNGFISRKQNKTHIRGGAE